MAMRTKLNLDGSNRRVAERLGMSGMPPGMPPGIPMEWLDAGNWRLPSGKALAEFALQAGFLAPLLFKAERFDPAEQSDGAEQFDGEVSVGAALPSQAKHFGKGNNR
jgi:hypothetical protein